MSMIVTCTVATCPVSSLSKWTLGDRSQLGEPSCRLHSAWTHHPRHAIYLRSELDAVLPHVHLQIFWNLVTFELFRKEALLHAESP
jgi:hypothetical protein